MRARNVRARAMPGRKPRERVADRHRHQGSTTSPRGAPMSRTDSIFTMPTTELQKRAEKAEQLLAQLAELFPGLVTMTETDRRHSDGRMRDGEPEALTAVIEVAEN